MDTKDFSPEFLENAKACTSKEEFMELLADEDVELSVDELEGVSGGSEMTLDEIVAACKTLPAPWLA